MASDWIHELRNAVNAVSLNASVVRILLLQGNTAKAAGFNDEVIKACERCRLLLDEAPPRDEGAA
ncbi:MAG: hypothetical protein EOP92_44790 [Lysobacteraceae bacterium]|jgi:hypothetical protein|nr:MAG: hypothetical protein EOP92_44790 [Xanthomonadaceae bacterium]